MSTNPPPPPAVPPDQQPMSDSDARLWAMLSQLGGIILGFIGLKLLLEALHSTTSLPVPTIPIWFSLLFIVGVLAITAATSMRAAGRPE